MDKNSIGISKVHADSSAEFENVFKTHFANLHGYACSIIKDSTAAEEIVQNVFYKLWEKRNKIDVRESLTAYLYKAVYHESLNYIKHNKVKAEYRVNTLHSSSENSNAADPAVLRELQTKIQLAMNELPEQCRTIFQLSRFEELKYNAIAHALGISVKTVENQMGKALRILRSKLAEYLPIIIVLVHHFKMPVS